MWEISQIVTDYAGTGGKILVRLFFANLIVRTVVFAVLRRFGALHPLMDVYWPRLPWRPLWRAIAAFRIWREEVFQMGGGQTGGWNSVLSNLCLQYRAGDVLLGRVRLWWCGWIQPMGFKAVRHLMIISGSGGGKTVFLITVLALLRKNQAAFVVDPKGQITNAAFAAQIKRGRPTAVLDPLNITDQPPASWNFLDEIAVLNERIGQDITTLMLDKASAAIIEKQPGEKPFFPNSAQLILGSVLGHVLTTEPPEQRTLPRAYELISFGYREHTDDPDEAMGLLWTTMKNNAALGGYIAKGGAFMLKASENGGNDVLATVRQAMKFLSHPQVQAVSQASTFNLCDLKGGNLWVSCVAPTTEIRGALKPWFRLLTMTALYCFEMIPGGLKTPCLFAIDELPALGNVPDIESALSVMRAYGIRFLGITTDLENLQRSNPQSWGGFLGNADAVFWMGLNHKPTAEFLAQTLGKATRKEKIGRGKDARHLLNEREVLTPDQVARFLSPKRGNMIVTRFGERPIRSRVMPYYTDLPVWLYEPDPEHREPAARAWLRRLLRSFSASTPRPSPAAARESSPDGGMAMDDARALFGLTGAYSGGDIEARSRVAAATFAPELVAQARQTLETGL